MISITDSAKTYLIRNLEHNGAIGIYVEIIKGGCSGMQYKFSHVKNIAEISRMYEEIVLEEKFKIFIDSSALLFIIGTTLDREQTKTGEKLVFKNPNEKHRCGCGKSFKC